MWGRPNTILHAELHQLSTSGAPTQNSSTTKETECVHPDHYQIDNLIVVIGYDKVSYRMTKVKFKANCTRLDIERHRLYAGSTVSYADCEKYAQFTSLRHDLNGCGVTGLRTVDFVEGCGTRSPVECLYHKLGYFAFVF
ncbi:hypothetical protein J6590_084335 [Homalodisca vitripennis]|nr:hypothetical protein J6590_084335 [Homalodisca vitripennis]